MRRNYSWTAVLAVWTIAPILRNGTAIGNSPPNYGTGKLSQNDEKAAYYGAYESDLPSRATNHRDEDERKGESNGPISTVDSFKKSGTEDANPSADGRPVGGPWKETFESADPTNLRIRLNELRAGTERRARKVFNGIRESSSSGREISREKHPLGWLSRRVIKNSPRWRNEVTDRTEASTNGRVSLRSRKSETSSAKEPDQWRGHEESLAIVDTDGKDETARAYLQLKIEEPYGHGKGKIEEGNSPPTSEIGRVGQESTGKQPSLEKHQTSRIGIQRSVRADIENSNFFTIQFDEKYGSTETSTNTVDIFEEPGAERPSASREFSVNKLTNRGPSNFRRQRPTLPVSHDRWFNSDKASSRISILDRKMRKLPDTNEQYFVMPKTETEIKHAGAAAELKEKDMPAIVKRENVISAEGSAANKGHHFVKKTGVIHSNIHVESNDLVINVTAGSLRLNNDKSVSKSPNNMQTHSRRNVNARRAKNQNKDSELIRHSEFTDKLEGPTDPTEPNLLHRFNIFDKPINKDQDIPSHKKRYVRNYEDHFRGIENWEGTPGPHKFAKVQLMEEIYGVEAGAGQRSRVNIEESKDNRRANVLPTAAAGNPPTFAASGTTIAIHSPPNELDFAERPIPRLEKEISSVSRGTADSRIREATSTFEAVGVLAKNNTEENPVANNSEKQDKRQISDIGNASSYGEIAGRAYAVEGGTESPEMVATIASQIYEDPASEVARSYFTETLGDVSEEGSVEGSIGVAADKEGALKNVGVRRSESAVLVSEDLKDDFADSSSCSLTGDCMYLKNDTAKPIAKLREKFNGGTDARVDTPIGKTKAAHRSVTTAISDGNEKKLAKNAAAGETTVVGTRVELDSALSSLGAKGEPNKAAESMPDSWKTTTNSPRYSRTENVDKGPTTVMSANSKPKTRHFESAERKNYPVNEAVDPNSLTAPSKAARDSGTRVAENARGGRNYSGTNEKLNDSPTNVPIIHGGLAPPRSNQTLAVLSHDGTGDNEPTDGFTSANEKRKTAVNEENEERSDEILHNVNGEIHSRNGKTNDVEDLVRSKKNNRLAVSTTPIAVLSKEEPDPRKGRRSRSSWNKGRSMPQVRSTIGYEPDVSLRDIGTARETSVTPSLGSERRYDRGTSSVSPRTDFGSRALEDDLPGTSNVLRIGTSDSWHVFTTTTPGRTTVSSETYEATIDAVEDPSGKTTMAIPTSSDPSAFTTKDPSDVSLPPGKDRNSSIDYVFSIRSTARPRGNSEGVSPRSINNSSHDTESLNQWPVKHNAVVEGDLVLGGLMMVHEREDTVTCGPVMPQGGVQALEAMLYTLDWLNKGNGIIPGVKIGAHILDDCDKDTYGLEMAVDFIKGRNMPTT